MRLPAIFFAKIERLTGPVSEFYDFFRKKYYYYIVLKNIIDIIMKLIAIKLL